MLDRLKKAARHLPALIGVALLFGAIYVVQKEFRSLRVEDISRALDAMPTSALLYALFWTFMSYYVLTFYDLLGTIYAGHRMGYGRVCFASFCAYSLSHNLGFAGCPARRCATGCMRIGAWGRCRSPSWWRSAA